jgi:phage terminase Nu1 subunit (DNA packaging protein)
MSNKSKSARPNRLPKDVSLGEIMWLLDASEQRVGQLVKDGVVEKAGRGRYLLSSVPKFIGEGRKRGEGTNEYNKARTRFLQAKAQRAERERDREEGEYLPADQVRLAWEALVMNCRNVALGVPSKVAARFSTFRTAADCQAACRSEIYLMLETLAATRFTTEDDPDGEDMDDEAA